MIRILKSLLISFSIYSKIPVPQFAWKEEDMRYTLCFFPWIGAVIGAVLWGWSLIAEYFSLHYITYVLIGTAIPLLISGGFHVDGYMDTMDAFCSYQAREKKLEILKDPHIGSFSVIMLVLYYFIYIGGFAQITTKPALAVFCMGFFLSRTLSGIGVVSFASAKEDGMLATFANTAQKWIVLISLYLQLLLCMWIMTMIEIKTAGLVCAAAIICFCYYRYRSYRELGGITGDVAGYFVTICEAAMAVAAAVGSLWSQW